MLKGMRIKYIPKIRTGSDGFGRPIFSYPDEQSEIIENVLVAPTLSNDLLSSTDLTGKKAVYTLAIPKGDTHDWENCLVVFFNERWKPFGVPLEGMEENIPLEWNKKVTVERYE